MTNILKFTRSWLLILFIILLGFLYSIPKVNSFQNEHSIYDIADRDIFLDSANPEVNFGTSNILKVGYAISDDARETYFNNHIYTREAYFHFSLTNKPKNYLKAELSLNIWSVSQMMNFTLCTIENEWNEYILTWNTNKPNKGEIIGNLIVTSNGISLIDITSIVNESNEVSICIYIEFDNYIGDDAYMTSREGYNNTNRAPRLIWTFINEDNNLIENIPPINYIFLLAIIGIIIIIIIKLTPKTS